ncbi:hypothetical protein [Microvirga brassicacearum]|uniref:DUF1127 domain-containing protein n=1 Tax=Microvirga brassicacearum TaxID=2580413 RepID=A0A5N3P8W2_9HYPH|nr:hypothetical protein [Microvirga brassicacearum]KAB0266174.1 hypothetical protein FEZ63_15565 [Microvirga brassicacearum]
MRHEDIGRARNVESVWLRIRLWLYPSLKARTPVVNDFSHLTEHQRRDIGLPEPTRYFDWNALQAEERFPDFTR